MQFFFFLVFYLGPTHSLFFFFPLSFSALRPSPANSLSFLLPPARPCPASPPGPANPRAFPLLTQTGGAHPSRLSPTTSTSLTLLLPGQTRVESVVGVMFTRFPDGPPPRSLAAGARTADLQPPAVPRRSIQIRRSRLDLDRSEIINTGQP
jgi:hypothetical protein